MLDGKFVRTPMRSLLGSPIQVLAKALASEWDAQDPVINREAMPITRLVCTAIDRVTPDRRAVVDSLMAYVDADLLCYRALYPSALKARQDEAWRPPLDWLQERFGVRFAVVEGVMPTQQSEDTAKTLRSEIESLSDEHLTAFQAGAAATKSLVLSLALVHGRLNSEDVAACAHLDEIFQAEQWGEDRQALIRRRDVDAEIRSVGQYLQLLS